MSGSAANAAARRRRAGSEPVYNVQQNRVDQNKTEQKTGDRN